ncbi:endonuclease/exonuclease/phosphatase family protein [Parasegetibacter sp. NRK P23]|uniref:endonuclease/exonuclease/phosphatase family protein n=1 Tax=Parasegetibacter sp. NRK P23 TaxID=2942999 RepID=UPI002044873F|nr:endonuclease/exonuclease/phosphatase family protein [Parasegetibacter sp. NRK P23]MCM5528206.1 endonuclease/exonuclease/phosphatase family protein [Parasegetibacter sp. NRK P23]
MRFIRFAACFLLLACSRKTTVPSGGNTTTGTVTGADLKILCYNIHHANPPSKPGVIDMAAIAGVINREKPDVVALQEVDVHTGRSGVQLHQAEDLAARTGMKAYFGKAIDYDGGEYGVAILSKLPMDEGKAFPLPNTGGEARVLATVRVKTAAGKYIRLACTHLDAQEEENSRILQVNKILELTKDETLPVVIAGDFNAEPSSAVIKALDSRFSRTCVANCGFTIPVINPTSTIDYIAFTPKKFDVLLHKVINEQYASDHLPVYAELKMK